MNNIIIPQWKYQELNSKLDVVDALVLESIRMFSRKTFRLREEDWRQIDYEELLREIPMIPIKSRKSFQRRLNRLSYEGFIRYKVIFGKDSFIITEKTESLYFG